MKKKLIGQAVLITDHSGTHDGRIEDVDEKMRAVEVRPSVPGLGGEFYDERTRWVPLERIQWLSEVPAPKVAEESPVS